MSQSVTGAAISLGAQGPGEHPSPSQPGQPPAHFGALLSGSRATPTQLQWHFQAALPSPGLLQLSQSRAELTKPQDFHITGTGTPHSPPLAPCAAPATSQNQADDQGAAFQLQIPGLQITEAAVCSPRFAEAIWGWPDDCLPSCPSPHVLTNCRTLMTSMVPPLSKPPVRRAGLAAPL